MTFLHLRQLSDQHGIVYHSLHSQPKRHRILLSDQKLGKELGTVIQSSEVATTLQGETEARSVTATLWVRGVFLPGFDPIFTIFALGIVASALARSRKD